jgi:DNA-binding NarL/FixJ family response regulator
MQDRPRRVGDFGALLRAAQSAQAAAQSSPGDQRRLVADLCRMLGQQVRETPLTESDPAKDSLSPRLSQTLDALLAGDSEKQIAQKLSISKHTVHVYVKALYKGFGVSSRAELLSRFINKQNAVRVSASRVSARRPQPMTIP